MRNCKVSNEQQEQILARFKEYLSTMKFGKKISFESAVEEQKLEEKVFVTFSAIAYIKMRELVDRCSYEVGWYGLIDKVAPKEYRVEDIVVYPQVVTSVTVKEDEEVWDDNATPDEIHRRHFHGHSHVNMDVSPSGTDLTHRSNLTQLLGPNDFYLFIITNKRCEISAELYDLADNAIYENDDIQFDVDMGNGSMLSGFIEESNARIKHTSAMNQFKTENKKQKTKKKPSRQLENAMYSNWLTNDLTLGDLVSEDPTLVNQFINLDD